MQKGPSNRVLARRVARELTEEETELISGGGTSFRGTGCSDAQGRSSDVEGYDCVENDTYTPAPSC